MHPWADYLLLISSIAAGAVTVYQFKLDRPAQLKILNAFTGGYLLCITCLHLLPELYHVHGEEHAHDHSGIWVGSLILAGFFIQIVLDTISMGVEHGHAHDLEHRLPLGVIAGLYLHAFIEAMALGNPEGHHDHASRDLLLWSIVIHNYPVSIAFLAILFRAGLERRRALTILGGFALMGPLGMTLSANTPLASHTRELTAIVIGIFMHISTTILFESSDLHRFNRGKLVAILIGTGLGVLTVVFH
ncbi:MAG: ZIP family metal transporter [Verrucomicrobia bacterium]|nr:ZIP family metal transporter [Verrucomicrobiota bacterium]